MAMPGLIGCMSMLFLILPLGKFSEGASDKHLNLRRCGCVARDSRAALHTKLDALRRPCDLFDVTCCSQTFAKKKVSPRHGSRCAEAAEKR